MATGTPPGLRQDYLNLAFHLDRDFLEYAYEVYRDELTRVDGVAGYVNVLAFQQITMNVLEHMKKNGGNALGLGPENSPLIIMNLSARWYDAADDETAVASSLRIFELTAEEAMEGGLYGRYVYQNYASPEQDVFRGYGEGNRRRLRAIATEWGPRGCFRSCSRGIVSLIGEEAACLSCVLEPENKAVGLPRWLATVYQKQSIMPPTPPSCIPFARQFPLHDRRPRQHVWLHGMADYPPHCWAETASVTF